MAEPQTSLLALPISTRWVRVSKAVCWRAKAPPEVCGASSGGASSTSPSESPAPDCSQGGVASTRAVSRRSRLPCGDSPNRQNTRRTDPYRSLSPPLDENSIGALPLKNHSTCSIVTSRSRFMWITLIRTTSPRKIYRKKSHCHKLFS